MATEGTLVLLLVLVMFSATERTSIERQQQCKKQLIENQKALNCSHQNLPYIPKTENHVAYLVLSYNKLRNISSKTFGNISDPISLTNLYLDHNNIQNISKTAIDAFQNLKYLDLSYNPIYYENMKSLLGELSNFRYLSHFHMNGIGTITIRKDLFSLVRENTIELLDVQFYNIKTLFMDAFGNFNNLSVLYLKNNHIENIKMSKNKHLKKLYLDNNQLKSFPDFSINGSESDCFLSNIEFLTVTRNVIKEIGFDNLKCLLKLKTLQLDKNPITVLQNNLLMKLTNLKALVLKSIGTDILTVKPLAFKSSSLRSLQFEYSKPARNVFVSFSETFKFLPNLRNLRLGLISMLQLTNKEFSALFSPLVNISSFECFACQISQDPKIILNYMTNVVDINLHSSQIKSLSDETFKENKHLQHLNLRYNDIAYIQKSALPISLLNNLHLLDLSHNPFACDCNLEWLINWMKTKQARNVIQSYPQQYICSLPKEKSKIRLADISFTYKECHPWSPWIWFAIIASPCVIVIATVVLLVYRNRWNIKHYIYLLRKRRNYQIINGHNFVYDAFVGYEAEDSAWVRRRLLAVLEDEAGLKLCIHERDFRPGVFINDNIVTNMNRSAKVVLVLSNAFARSGWCMFELKIAHSKLIEDETEMVVILLEKIDGRNMNHSLKLLFETTTYIEWTEDVVGQELFWAKLKNVLKN